jgi:hypothetical protein
VFYGFLSGRYLIALDREQLKTVFWSGGFSEFLKYQKPTSNKS